MQLLRGFVEPDAGIGDDDAPGEARARLDDLVGEAGRDVAERLASMLGLTDAIFTLDDTVWALELYCTSAPNALRGESV